MKKVLLGLLLTGLSLMAASGEALSAKCVACHGANFEKSALGKSAIVNGQSASDIYSSLVSYKQGTRNTAGMGALMKGQTATMSNNDLWAIAEYVASLSEEPAPAAEAAPANDWVFACNESDLSWVNAGRYFKVAASDAYPGVGADSKTIQIDRKNKTIKVWTIWLLSELERQRYIQARIKALGQSGDDYSNYGYFKSLDIIDFRNMRVKIFTMTDYECSGSVIETTNMNSTWSEIVPDSVMEGMTKKIMQKYNLK